MLYDEGGQRPAAGFTAGCSAATHTEIYSTVCSMVTPFIHLPNTLSVEINAHCFLAADIVSFISASFGHCLSNGALTYSHDVNHMIGQSVFVSKLFSAKHLRAKATLLIIALAISEAGGDAKL